MKRLFVTLSKVNLPSIFYLREGQLKAMAQIPNCGMVVPVDTGEKNCIHPANKKATENRLTYWALGKTHGIKAFKNAPNKLTSFGKELSCFEIACKDNSFYLAKASIIRNSSLISVHSPKVGEPEAVRYAFKDFVRGDLFSTGGMPVSSFRTDDWK